jgi:hypothetical protein
MLPCINRGASNPMGFKRYAHVAVRSGLWIGGPIERFGTKSPLVASTREAVCYGAFIACF